MFDYSSYDATLDDEVAGDMSRAFKISPDSIQIDRDSRTAQMKASHYNYWYDVTLDFCSCESFSIARKQKSPCKHMFRLAHELGIKLKFPEVIPARASKYDLSVDLEVIHSRWVNGEITYEAYKSCKSALEKSVKESKKMLRKKK